MEFIETSVFTKQINATLPDDEYRLLQAALVTYPDSGKLIIGSGGLRKIRWRTSGKGKRGGVRVIYYWAVSEEKILFLYMYPKGVADDLTLAQLRILRNIVKEEYP